MKLPEDAKVATFLDKMKALGTPVADTNPDRFLQGVMKGRSYELPEIKTNLYKAIGRDPRFNLCEHEQVVSAVGELFSQGQSSGKIEDVLNRLGEQLGPDAHKQLNRAAASPIFDSAPKAKPIKDTASKAGGAVEKFYSKWNSLSPEHQMNAGMFGIGAFIGTCGFIKNASNSVRKDMDGSTHVVWSNVAVALLEGTLAALCAGLAIQAVRSGSAR